MAHPSLVDLPDEVIQCILSYTHANTAIALERTSCRFRDVANEASLWKDYCHSTFRYWSGGTKPQLEDYGLVGTGGTWKDVYAAKTKDWRFTHQTLNVLIENPVGRCDTVSRLLDRGMHIKDALLDSFENAQSSPNHLAQKYWAHAALGCLHRRKAVEIWFSMRSGENESMRSFEMGMGAFDLFILNSRREGDIADISARLDEYAAEIRGAHPDIDDQPPRQRAITVADYLLKRSYTGLTERHHYHSLDRMFLGVALYSPSRDSLPLITAFIYCAVARKFDLVASPCSFPFHVHVIVRPPNGFDLDGNVATDNLDAISAAQGGQNFLHMDPFHSSEPVALDSLHQQLRFIASQQRMSFTEEQIESFVTEAPLREMIVRHAKNVAHSPDYSPPPPQFPIDAPAAAYASQWALVMLPAYEMQLRQYLAHLMQHFVERFELDLPLVEEYISPMIRHSDLPDFQHYNHLLHSLRAQNSVPKTPKHRTGPNSVVKYRVGQVFRHRLRGYVAVITGWDNHCKMAEEWIVMNQVARLERGRHQPFYNVIVEDESVRYIAEDNIVLERIEADDVDRIFPIEIGKHFKRFEQDLNRGLGGFVSNILDEYPED